jgi:type I restriction enzyme S subunit
LINSLDAGVSVNSVDELPRDNQHSILKTSCVSNGYFEKNERKRVGIPDEISRLKEELLSDSILISRMNTPFLVGANAYIHIAPPRTYVPDRLWQVKINHQKCNMKWLSYVLSSDKGRESLRAQATGTSNSMKNITKKDVFQIQVSFPDAQEQTKIADFLSSVDEKIIVQTKQYELMCQYKKGVMQKIFSQELRFKDENRGEFPEWEHQAINNFLSESLIKGSKGDQAKKLTVKLWGKGVVPKTEVYQGSENTQYYVRKAGQFIYGKLDFLNCAFGIIPQDLDGFESTIDSPAFDIQCIDPAFLLESIKRKEFYKKMGELADGSRKAKRIHASEFLSMELDIPHMQEQTKIADFLTAIDDKITAAKSQLNQLKQWKQGLLQRMFI